MSDSDHTQSIRFPGEDMAISQLPGSVIPLPESEVQSREVVAEIEDTGQSAHAESEGAVPEEAQPIVLSDTVRRIVKQMNVVRRQQEYDKLMFERNNPRHFSTNSAGMIRQLGSLTFLQARSRRSKR